jgi:hypothetical protein
VPGPRAASWTTARPDRAMESKQMWWWPGLAVLGFLALIALVVALGTVSTKRYEQERSEQAAPPELPGGGQRRDRSRPDPDR